MIELLITIWILGWAFLVWLFRTEFELTTVMMCGFWPLFPVVIMFMVITEALIKKKIKHEDQKESLADKIAENRSHKNVRSNARL